MKSIRGKATVGGIVVLGVALAMFLQGLGIDVGTGRTTPENGAETGTPIETVPSDSQANLQTRSPDRVGRPERADDPPPLAPVVNLPDTTEMLTVIVEERHYLWATNETNTLPVQRISLSEIVDKARQTTGNPQGIRVRIFHVGSALPSAETELVNALKLAGVSELEIYFEQRVIELPVH